MDVAQPFNIPKKLVWEAYLRVEASRGGPGVDGQTIEAVEFATLEWVDWFNHRRLLAPIGHIPPAEHEEQYYQRHETPAMVAGVH